ncbi:MAG: UDP-N-acetylmuramoyl-L-alanine--D-glutamate ligase, partial [Spirochaetes bacterium]|nr:UDP-N-acetylmuramoyl-L-alanine--D-glutamate ligase [Spirochaetota bacterium]
MKAPESYAGARVTVMGLGLHGGGASAARFFAHEGAEVTVTDLRDGTELAASLDSIASLPIRFVLGRHEDADFAEAD